MRLLQHILVAALLAATLSACGNNTGADFPNELKSELLKGTTGNRQHAMVTIKDSLGREFTTLSDTTGNYSVNAKTLGMKSPYVAKAVFDNGSTAYAVSGSSLYPFDINGNTSSWLSLISDVLDLSELYLTVNITVMTYLAEIIDALHNKTGV